MQLKERPEKWVYLNYNYSAKRQGNVGGRPSANDIINLCSSLRVSDSVKLGMPYGAQVAVRYSYQIQLPYMYNTTNAGLQLVWAMVSCLRRLLQIFPLAFWPNFN